VYRLTLEQVPLKERFARAPFIQFTKGEPSGLVGFDRALTDEELAFVREKLKTVSGKDLTWEVAEGQCMRSLCLCPSLKTIWWQRSPSARSSSHVLSSLHPAHYTAHRCRKTGPVVADVVVVAVDVEEDVAAGGVVVAVAEEVDADAAVRAAAAVGTKRGMTTGQRQARSASAQSSQPGASTRASVAQACQCSRARRRRRRQMSDVYDVSGCLCTVACIAYMIIGLRIREHVFVRSATRAKQGFWQA
jgi:hypothetical protein